MYKRKQCKECSGSGICEHGRRRNYCKECGGSQICEHGRCRYQCKECGTFLSFLKNGFTTDEIKEMGAVHSCQFPECLMESNSLCSDHRHDGSEINPENYRGEICRGHNLLLKDLDEHPEWMTVHALEYVLRRPYSRA